MNTEDSTIKERIFAAVISSIKWILFGIICGAVVGAAGSLFALSIRAAAALRTAHPMILFLLPAAGCIIIFCYHMIGSREDKGTNTVIAAIRNGENVPPQMAPLIFLATVLTHFGGGSAGREGAALQLGGSIGDSLGRLFHFRRDEQRTIVMCGMSAAFSALFGTPLTAAVFAIEVSTIGILYDSALVPCVISALTAHAAASLFGLSGESYAVQGIPPFSFQTAVLTGILALLCALISIFFCVFLHGTERLAEEKIRNEYLRIILSAVILILLTLLVGSQMYNGAGSQFIEQCFEENALGLIVPYAFLLKMLFTAVTLAGGFKGGEIVPSLFVGAGLGTVYRGAVAALLPGAALNTPLWAAVGMGCLFCGVTNCPVASIMLCFEMFGFDGMPYYMLAVALAYMCSGHYGLYHSQKILYSKFGPARIDTYIHD